MDVSIWEYALSHVAVPVLNLAIQEIDKTVILTDDEKDQLAATGFSFRQTDRDPGKRQKEGLVPYATIKRLPTLDPVYEVTVHVSTRASVPPVPTDDAREKYLTQLAMDLSFLVIMAILQIVRLLREDTPVVDARDQGRLLTRPLGKLAVRILMSRDFRESLSPILDEFSQH